jgi:hypothetical protein
VTDGNFFKLETCFLGIKSFMRKKEKKREKENSKAKYKKIQI